MNFSLNLRKNAKIFLTGVLLLMVLDTAYANPNESKENAYDNLEALRLNIIGAELEIYQSVVDKASGEAAAKRWAELHEDRNKILQLEKKLGPPSQEIRDKLNKKYGSRLQSISHQSIQASVALAGTPNGKALDDVRQRYLLELKQNEIAEAQGAEGNHTSNTEAKKAYGEYLELTEALGQSLSKATDSKAALAIKTETEKLLNRWRQSMQAFQNFGPDAGPVVIQMTGRSRKAHQNLMSAVFTVKQNKESSKILESITSTIMESLADK